MIRGLISLYTPNFPAQLVALQKRSGGSLVRYYAAFWSTSNFGALHPDASLFSRHDKMHARLLVIFMVFQLCIGAAIVSLDIFRTLDGGWQFGLAIMLATPLVWAHASPVVGLMSLCLQPKVLGRRILCALLEAQVRRLRAAHDFTVIAVAGSVGKTSTKSAIAAVIGASRRAQWQVGNYNDRVTVPLIFFGHTEPAIFNVLAWIRILFANERSIRNTYPYDVVIAELGTDGPGFMQEFAYVRPDITVLTAVTPEHMEYFGTLDAVAAEELTILSYSAQTLVNVDDTPHAYLTDAHYLSYGLDAHAEYQVISRRTDDLTGQYLALSLAGAHLDVRVPMLGEQGAKIALAALSAASLAGLSEAELQAGAARIAPFAGRMQILPGIKQSTLIDDTYNASPVAVTAALDVLCAASATQRIALLGSMNELGDYSREAHEAVGAYCDPQKIDTVIALGPDAVTYLAPAAASKGCHVETFFSPYEAGTYIASKLKKGAVVLAKGSQNRVFAEEALKSLLAHKSDEEKLVRQSAYWLAVKSKQFMSDR